MKQFSSQSVRPSQVILFRNPLMQNKPRPTIVLDGPDDTDRQLVVPFSSKLKDYSFQEYFPSNGVTRLRERSCLVLPCYGYAPSWKLRKCPQLFSWDSSDTLQFWEQVLLPAARAVHDIIQACRPEEKSRLSW